MAEQPQVPEDITPAQFFEQLLPMGFEAQSAGGAGGAAPTDFAIQFTLTGDGGGTWLAKIHDGKMTVTPGAAPDANLSVALSVNDWRDAVLNRNGATLGIILPANRPGKPDNSGRAKALKGTMALELAREGDPFTVELCFNGAATPRTLLRMAIAEYVGMQDGSQNGQMLFMQGKIKVEGDMGFLMQIAALNM